MRRKNLYAPLIAAALALTLAVPSGAAAKSDLSGVRKQAEDIKKNIDDVQKEIDSLKDSKEDMESYVQKMDNKLNELSEQLTKLEEDLKQKENDIEATNAELSAAKETEKKQYEGMKKRMKFMYENGNTSYMELILTADNISDFLNKADYVSKISKYDRDLLKEYQETKNKIEDTEKELELEKEALTVMQKEIADQKSIVKTVIDAKSAEIQNHEEQIEGKEDQVIDYEKQLREETAQIQQMEAEIKAQEDKIKREAEEAASRREEALRQQAEAQRQYEEAVRQQQEAEQKRQEAIDKGDDVTDLPEVPVPEKPAVPEIPAVPELPSYDSGRFAWPVNGRVTSEYGPRNSPTAGASSDHKGIDIAAPSGTPIVAAYDGVVASKGYSNSMGNYVYINHGDGLRTVYMHCSTVTTTAGAKVKKGSLIAKVGSTGVSTGPHCHLGVILNGNYVNPRNYLE